MEVGRRHLPAAPPDEDDAGVPDLVAELRAEIERDGPITFARFMQRALYEPGLGYYATSVRRPTRAGDFLTAPELHPIFGHALARQMHELWMHLGEPEQFVLREYGAGTGSLGLAIADGLLQMSSPLGDRLRYQPVELPAQLGLIEGRFAEAGRADLLERYEPGRPLVGCVLANEFVDALPVHRVEWLGGSLGELYVTWQDGRFADVRGEQSVPELEGWFAGSGVQPAEGQRAEVNLAMVDWLRGVGHELERGYLLAIDYGAPARDLYGPSRHSGTLRAFRGQQVSSDVLGGAGRRDMTAHVDLDALEREAIAAGLDVLGRTTQAEFLVGCGLEELLEGARERAAEDWEELTLLRSAVRRLLDPRQLGGYAVVVAGRGVSIDPPLSGLSYRLPARH